jgi:MATE family multidrug resistance protein
MGPGNKSVKPISHRRVWGLALPIMISNLTIPLLGAVDTAVVGHLPESYHLGAVAVGAMLFSYIYWGFGFLKMGTTGFVSHAWGAGDGKEVRAAMARAILLAGIISTLLLLLQLPIIRFAMWVLNGSSNVEALGSEYFLIRIWGAPAALANYVLLGWFIGIQNTRAALAVNLVMNGLNIVLDLLFVIGFGWGVAGVAAATLISEYVAMAFAFVLVARELRKIEGIFDRALILSGRLLRKMLSLNGNIFIRNFCLTFGFSIFTAIGAQMGDDILAANAVIMTLLHITAYGLDGFSHAAEALVGGFIGGKNRSELERAIKFCGIWALTFAAGFMAVYFVAGGLFVRLLTSVPAVVQMADGILIWAIISPLIAVWSFLLDGIFVGAMRGRDMRNGMVISLAVFLLALWPAFTFWGVHGLWAALMVFFAARGITLAVRYPKVVEAAGQ